MTSMKLSLPGKRVTLNRAAFWLGVHGHQRPVITVAIDPAPKDTAKGLADLESVFAQCAAPFTFSAIALEVTFHSATQLVNTIQLLQAASDTVHINCRFAETFDAGEPIGIA